MAKATIAPIASALCVLAIATVTVGHSHRSPSTHDTFDVVGRVYCDTCRVQFETKLSKRIAGAKVKLICRNPVSQHKTFETSTVSNATGHYTIGVVGDHEDEICELSVFESPDESCNEPMEGLNTARIELALNAGMPGAFRFANSLGFMTKKALPQCKKVLDDMGFKPHPWN